MERADLEGRDYLQTACVAGFQVLFGWGTRLRLKDSAVSFGVLGLELSGL